MTAWDDDKKQQNRSRWDAILDKVGDPYVKNFLEQYPPELEKFKTATGEEYRSSLTKLDWLMKVLFMEGSGRISMMSTNQRRQFINLVQETIEAFRPGELLADTPDYHGNIQSRLDNITGQLEQLRAQEAERDRNKRDLD